MADNWWDNPVTITPAAPPPSAPASADWWNTPPSATNIDDLAPKETPKKQGSVSSPTDQAWEFVKHLVSASPIGQTAGMGAQILAPRDAVHGALLSNQQMFDEAREALKKGDYGNAAVKGFYYLLNGIPGLGSQLNEAGSQMNRGEWGAGAGTAMGLGTSFAAPEVIKNQVLPAVETAMANRAKANPASVTQFTMDLRKAIPSKSGAPYTEQDVGRAAPYLASEHAAVPIEDVGTLRDAATSAVHQVEAHVEKYIALHPNDLIRTNPLRDVKDALARGVRPSDIPIGVKEIEELGLGEPMTLSTADAIRNRLNAENDAVLARNNYDQALARRADPAFVAREVAARSLRDGVYDQLEERGISGVRELRRDEGSLIAVRNAAQYHSFNADAVVKGTGMNSPLAKIARRVVPAAAAGAGEYFGGGGGGVLGAAGTAVLADQALQALVPPNLTRGELIAKAFQKLKIKPPQYPFAPPEPEIRGLLTPPPIVSARAPLSPSDTFIPNRTVVSPDTSGTGGLVPGFYQPTQLRLPGAPVTEAVPTEPSVQAVPGRPGFTAEVPDRSGLVDIPTKSYVVRDPTTGRFKRVYIPDWSGQK